MKRVLAYFFLLSFLLLAMAAYAFAEQVTLGDENDDLMGTPFTKAATSGDLAIVKNLVTQGADVNQKINFTGRTALMKAAEKGHIDIVRYLIEKGADVNYKADMAGDTALEDAANGGYLDIVRLLIEKGALINKGGVAPLIAAAEKGHTEVVRFLIVKGADINANNGQGTALMASAAGGYTDIVQILLDKGANVNVNNGGTALMFAAREGHTAIVQALIKKGADLNATDSTGYNALSLAQARGHSDTALVLKEAIEKASKQSTNTAATVSLSLEDTNLLKQLQPPATEAEKKLYLEAKKKNQVSRFMAERKYFRIVRTLLGNKNKENMDIDKAPPLTDYPDVCFGYELDFNEQLLLFNIALYQSIDLSQRCK
ncbi:MAG TPA: ankyrin repeat domain-containing protein [Smithella sp.]|nr:ankyrin repeat domain-containing protein [Smithella sp.]